MDNQRKNINFAQYANIMAMKEDINRLKVVLAEQKRTNKWLAEQLGKILLLLASGARILHSLD